MGLDCFTLSLRCGDISHLLCKALRKTSLEWIFGRHATWMDLKSCCSWTLGVTGSPKHLRRYLTLSWVLIITTIERLRWLNHFFWLVDPFGCLYFPATKKKTFLFIENCSVHGTLDGRLILRSVTLKFLFQTQQHRMRQRTIKKYYQNETAIYLMCAYSRYKHEDPAAPTLVCSSCKLQ